MFVGVRDNGYPERIFGRSNNRQTHAIYGHRAFINRHVSPLCHFTIKFVFKSEIPATIGFFHFLTHCCVVDMSLNDMPVESTIHHHTPFQIHLTSYFKQS